MYFIFFLFSPTSTKPVGMKFKLGYFCLFEKVISGLKIRFDNLEGALVGQRISFLDSDGDALEKISRFSSPSIDECDFFFYVLDKFCGFGIP